MKEICVNGNCYAVVRLLGRGKGGYSYLVSDGQREYVVKQIHHEPCAYYRFGDKLGSELKDYARLRSLGLRMPELYDVDRAEERILKEYIAGPTVAELVRKNLLEQYCFDQIRDMCAKVYGAGLNIDYYPTNFVVRNAQLYYIDYECNPYSDQWNFENWGIRYWVDSTAIP